MLLVFHHVTSTASSKLVVLPQQGHLHSQNLILLQLNVPGTGPCTLSLRVWLLLRTVRTLWLFQFEQLLVLQLIPIIHSCDIQSYCSRWQLLSFTSLHVFKVSGGRRGRTCVCLLLNFQNFLVLYLYFSHTSLWLLRCVLLCVTNMPSEALTRAVLEEILDKKLDEMYTKKLAPLQDALNFLSGKYDELINTISQQDTSIKNLVKETKRSRWRPDRWKPPLSGIRTG